MPVTLIPPQPHRTNGHCKVRCQHILEPPLLNCHTFQQCCIEVAPVPVLCSDILVLKLISVLVIILFSSQNFYFI